MVTIKTISVKNFLSIRGRLGRPNCIGQMRLGWSKLGEVFLPAGIYQKRLKSRWVWNNYTSGLGVFHVGQALLGKNAYKLRNGRKMSQQIVRLNHYRPTNNRLPRQQAFRDFFRFAVAIYHSLPVDIVAFYTKRSKKYQMTGYNYFISEYTNIKPSYLGNFRLGLIKMGVKMYHE